MSDEQTWEEWLAELRLEVNGATWFYGAHFEPGWEDEFREDYDAGRTPKEVLDELRRQDVEPRQY
jgi:hypothetical protein